MMGFPPDWTLKPFGEEPSQEIQEDSQPIISRSQNGETNQ